MKGTLLYYVLYKDRTVKDKPIKPLPFIFIRCEF